jgi:twitching motility two-component system response regulator PilG
MPDVSALIGSQFRPKQESAVDAESQIKSGKILVIDDSSTIRRTAEITLKQVGYEVILADDGFDALAQIVDHQPALIFLDIMMPRLDGYATCGLIKRNPMFQATPVIMLSSKDSVFDRARGRLVGANEYLTKPFTKEALLAAVALHLPSSTSNSDLKDAVHADRKNSRS